MVLLKYGDYYLKTVETALGHSYPLITGICIWYKDTYIGIVEPANDAIAKFTTYPPFILDNAEVNLAVVQRLIQVSTDIIQDILTLA